MLGNYKRLAIWGLDNLLNLDSIKELLSENYNYPIDFLEEYDVSESEKTFYNHWAEPIEIQETIIYGKKVKFINAIGKYEYGFGEKRSFLNEELLPRELRVFNKTTDVLFFDFEGKVYCIVETSESQESKIRSALFGQRNGNKMEAWGKVSSRSPLPYQFDSNFFYWLLSKKGNHIIMDGQVINLIDVSAISLLSDRNVYDSHSEGPNLLDGSIPALSALGVNENIYLVGLKLRINNTTLDFRVGNDGVVFINKDRCYQTENDQIISFSQGSIFFLLLIYRFIFPELLKQFESDQDWNKQKEAEQRKRWALSAIRNLVVENSISLDDLKDIYMVKKGKTMKPKMVKQKVFKKRIK